MQKMVMQILRPLTMRWHDEQGRQSRVERRQDCLRQDAPESCCWPCLNRGEQSFKCCFAGEQNFMRDEPGDSMVEEHAAAFIGQSGAASSLAQLVFHNVRYDR